MKSKLILGRQGAGKTTLLNKLMSENICVGYDEVSSVEQLEKIVEQMSVRNDEVFVVSSQLKADDIPECLLSKFELIDLGDGQKSSI